MFASTCSRLSVLLILLWQFSLAHAAAPPAQLSPAQRKQWKERAALGKRAIELFRQGKTEEWD
jgi:hypothetical protein